MTIGLTLYDRRKVLLFWREIKKDRTFARSLKYNLTQRLIYEIEAMLSDL